MKRGKNKRLLAFNAALPSELLGGSHTLINDLRMTHKKTQRETGRLIWMGYDTGIETANNFFVAVSQFRTQNQKSELDVYKVFPDERESQPMDQNLPVVWYCTFWNSTPGIRHDSKRTQLEIPAILKWPVWRDSLPTWQLLKLYFNHC